MIESTRFTLYREGVFYGRNDSREACRRGAEARTLRVPTGLHPHRRRLRYRTRQRVAIPVYHGRIRRRRLRAAVPDLPGHPGPARHGHGIRRRPREPEKLGAGVRRARAQTPFPLVQLVPFWLKK